MRRQSTSELRKILSIDQRRSTFPSRWLGTQSTICRNTSEPTDTSTMVRHKQHARLPFVTSPSRHLSSQADSYIYFWFYFCFYAWATILFSRRMIAGSLWSLGSPQLPPALPAFVLSLSLPIAAAANLCESPPSPRAPDNRGATASPAANARVVASLSAVSSTRATDGAIAPVPLEPTLPRPLRVDSRLPPPPPPPSGVASSLLCWEAASRFRFRRNFRSCRHLYARATEAEDGRLAVPHPQRKVDQQPRFKNKKYMRGHEEGIVSSTRKQDGDALAGEPRIQRDTEHEPAVYKSGGSRRHTSSSRVEEHGTRRDGIRWNKSTKLVWRLSRSGLNSHDAALMRRLQVVKSFSAYQGAGKRKRCTVGTYAGLSTLPRQSLSHYGSKMV